jgi:hypothetical protein
LFDWPTICTDLDLEVSSVKLFMVASAQALQRTKPETRHVAIMWFDVVHDGCRHGAAFGFAKLAQWTRSKMVAAALAPT